MIRRTRRTSRSARAPAAAPRALEVNDLPGFECVRFHKLGPAGLEAVHDASTLAVPNAPSVRDVESERRSAASAARTNQGDFVTVVHACEHVVHELDGEGLLVRGTFTDAEAARACRRHDAGAQDHAAAAALQKFKGNHLPDLQAVCSQKVAPTARENGCEPST